MATAPDPIVTVTNVLKGLSVAAEALRIDEFSALVEQTKAELTQEFIAEGFEPSAEVLEGARERRAKALEEIFVLIGAVVGADHFFEVFEKALAE